MDLSGLVDFDLWQTIAINLVMTFLNAIFDISNDGSLIMILWHLTPLGNNSLPLETWVLLAASLGIFAAYKRGWLDEVLG